MANPPTETDIVNIINVGPYNITYEFFDHPQIPERRHYPSIEVEKIGPQATDRTKEYEYNKVTFNIRIFQRILTDGNQEQPNQEQAEQQILNLLESSQLSLETHRIIIENKNWVKERMRETGKRYYLKSTLTLYVKDVRFPTMTLDGFLTFNVSGSSVDNPPLSDFTYLAIYDVTISDGYRDISEYVVSNPDGQNLPVNYAGGFNGTFIGHIVLDSTTIGTTGEKLNHLRDLRANGEKPDIQMTYVNKSNESPTPQNVTEGAFKMRISSIDRIYETMGNVVYRIRGKITKPGTIVGG